MRLPWLLAALLLPASAAATTAPSSPTPFPDIRRASLPALPDAAARPSSIPAGKPGAALAISFPPAPPLAPAQRGRRKAPAPPGPHQEITAHAARGCLRIMTPERQQFTLQTAVLAASEGVLPIQTEHLSTSEDGATLSITQLWLDARTGGTRDISHTLLPLTRLHQSPQGPVLWGVVSPQGLHLLAQANAGVSGFDHKGEPFSGDCPQFHALLPVAPGGSQLSVSLPHSVFVRQANAPEIIPTTRVFQINATLSQLSRDPEPVLSITTRAEPLPPQVVLVPQP